MSLDTLNIARRKLNEALGEKSVKYFNHMKQWFRMKLTKEEFDSEARALLTLDQIHYHNEFLLALLNKVEGLAETSLMTIAQEKESSHSRNSRRHKRSSRTSEKSNFEAADLLEYLPPNSPPGAGSDGVKYAAQEIFLPDHALVVGRFMLAAWELGLEGAEDDAADIIVVAVQNFLKNVIAAVLSQRKGYKMHNRSFMYDIGGDVPNMWLRNSSKVYDPQFEGRVNVDDGPDALGPRCPPSIDEVEQSAAFELACSSTRESYGDHAIGYVQIKRNGDLCTVKCRVTPEHKVRKEGYRVVAIINEAQNMVQSCQCEDCAASEGGCKHAAALLLWLHRRSEEPPITSVTCYWKKSKLSTCASGKSFIKAKEMGHVSVDNSFSQVDILSEFIDAVKEKDCQASILRYFQEDQQTISIHKLCSSMIGKLDSPQPFLEILSNQMTTDNINKIFSTTKHQSDSPLWFELSVPNSEPNDDILTIDEVYSTLLTHKNVIACHSVYAVNMERIACMLNHPSY